METMLVDGHLMLTRRTRLGWMNACEHICVGGLCGSVLCEGAHIPVHVHLIHVSAHTMTVSLTV